MSKPSAPRREADNEAKAVLRTIRVSPRKLDLVAATIRGEKASSAGERPHLLEEAASPRTSRRR